MFGKDSAIISCSETAVEAVWLVHWYDITHFSISFLNSFSTIFLTVSATVLNPLILRRYSSLERKSSSTRICNNLSRIVHHSFRDYIIHYSSLQIKTALTPLRLQYPCIPMIQVCCCYCSIFINNISCVMVIESFSCWYFRHHPVTHSNYFWISR